MIMTRAVLFGILALVLLALVNPAAALVSEVHDVNAYSVSAEPGYVIYEIIIDNVPIGTNQTHVLNYNGATFLLSIGTYSSYGIWKNADITLTLPNGTVQTVHTSATTIVGQYKTTIQPVFAEAQSATIAFLSVDLMIGVNPVGAQFSTQPLGWNPSSSIPFSAASGNVGANTNIFVHQLTEADFQNHVVNYDPLFGATNLGSQLFSWAWSGVLAFVNMIPVIGPAFVTFLSFVGIVLPELLFWIQWIFENFPAILLSAETLMIMMAIASTPKKASITKTVGKLYQYHVSLFNGFFRLLEITRDLTVSIIDLIAKIVQAMKPI